jgi:hypothetical protein
MRILAHAFLRAPRELNIIAAVVLLRDENIITEEITFPKWQRVELWRIAEKMMGWTWVYPESLGSWLHTERALRAIAGEDDDSLEWVPFYDPEDLGVRSWWPDTSQHIYCCQRGDNRMLDYRTGRLYSQEFNIPLYQRYTDAETELWIQNIANRGSVDCAWDTFRLLYPEELLKGFPSMDIRARLIQLLRLSAPVQAYLHRKHDFYVYDHERLLHFLPVDPIWDPRYPGVLGCDVRSATVRQAIYDSKSPQDLRKALLGKALAVDRMMAFLIHQGWKRFEDRLEGFPGS